MQMHAPFLSCCELWYGTNRICYDFVLRETRHPEFSISKMLQFKVPQWLWIPTKAIWHDIQIKTLVICYLYSHWVLSNCCDPCRDSRTLTNKMLTLTIRVTQKHVFYPPKIKTSFICHESLSLKLSYAKKSMGLY